MQKTTRSVLSAVVAVPLVAGALVPATAAEAGHIKSSGSFASIDLSGPDTSDVIPGNYLLGSIDVFDDMAMGWVMTFECADGETPESGDECVWVGEVYLDGMDVTVTRGKGKGATTTVSGELWANHFYYDDETGEEFYTDLGTLTINASLTPYGKPLRITETVRFRDGNTGESFSYRVTQTVNEATVNGTLGDLSLDGRAGYVGSYRSQDRWNMP
jgi:hypothetical protein